MTRLAMCALLVSATGCGGSPTAVAPAQPTPAPTADSDAAVEDPEPQPHTDGPTHIARAAKRGAPHSSSIDRLVLSPDGKSALSRDNLGGVRLWTALDGTAEPMVVPVRGAQSFAVAAGDDTWLVAAVDSAGAAHILRAPAGGDFEELAVTPPYEQLEQIEVLPGGEHVILLRADHTIALLDAKGTELAILERRDFRPKQLRVTSDGTALIALFLEQSQQTTEVSLQRIDITLGDTPALTVSGKAPSFTAAAAMGHPHTAVSPSGDEFAYLELDTTKSHLWRVHIVNLATGSDRLLADELALNNQATLGYVGEDKLVVSAGAFGKTWLIDLGDGDDLFAKAGPPSHFGGVFMPEAFGPRTRVIGVGKWLFVQDVIDDDNRYLGYSAFEPISLSFSPSGNSVAWVASQGHVYIEPLDDAAAPVAHFETSMMSPVLKTYFVDEDHLIFADSVGGLRLVERMTNKELSAADTSGPFGVSEYDAKLGLLRILRNTAETWIYEVSLENGFQGPYIISDSSTMSGLLDAKSDEEPILWTLDASWKQRTYTLAELRKGLSRDDMMDRGDVFKVNPGSAPMAVGRDNTRYHLRYDATNEVSVDIFADGALEKNVPLVTNQVARLTASPDGSKFAVSQHTGVIYVYDRESGALAWSEAMSPNVFDLVWSPDSSTVSAVSQLGAAIFDATSGVAVYRTCGPRFESRASAPANLFPTVHQPNICER
jgi:WD40 repeat protein